MLGSGWPFTLQDSVAGLPSTTSTVCNWSMNLGASPFGFLAKMIKHFYILISLREKQTNKENGKLSVI